MALCCFLVLVTLLPAQADELGSPLIRNFSSDEVGAYPQNFAGVQDQRGLLYFGNF